MSTERELLEQAGIDPSDERAELAIFGREVEQFVDEHPIGKYLIQRAQDDIEAAKVALLEVDPTKVDEVRALQSKAAIAKSVRQWLREAIIAGRNADVSLTQEHDEHGGS